MISIWIRILLRRLTNSSSLDLKSNKLSIWISYKYSTEIWEISEKFLGKKMKTCISYSSTSTVTMSSDKKQTGCVLVNQAGYFPEFMFCL